MPGVMGPLVRAARPRQWLKNVLVFAAPGAAGLLDEGAPLVRAVGAFGAFCLVASATYLLNDIADVEADRAHPTKRFRPIASGALAVPVAWVAAGVAAAAGLALGGRAGGWPLVGVLAGYQASTAAYSLWLKHVPVVDLVVVAAGFVLRAVAGAVAVDVPISDWFFIVTSFASLFMVTGKRAAEINGRGDGAADTRRVLGAYTPGFLAYLRTVSSGAALVGYCLWAFEKADVVEGGFPWYQLSIVPFSLAIFRYALRLDGGAGEAPEDVVLSDPVLLAGAAAWVITFALGVYAT